MKEGVNAWMAPHVPRLSGVEDKDSVGRDGDASRNPLGGNLAALNMTCGPDVTKQPVSSCPQAKDQICLMASRVASRGQRLDQGIESMCEEVRTGSSGGRSRLSYAYDQMRGFHRRRCLAFLRRCCTTSVSVSMSEAGK
jgi:hypothetical protein